MKLILIPIILLSFLLTGCGGDNYTIKPEWDKSKLAIINVYRTNIKFHSANPEKPSFYIDDQQFAKLGSGSTASIKVLAGKHILTVKQSFMFMPSYEIARLEIYTEEGGQYYIRYSKDPSTLFIAGPDNINTTGKSTIHVVNKEYFQNRK